MRGIQQRRQQDLLWQRGQEWSAEAGQAPSPDAIVIDIVAIAFDDESQC